LFLFLFLFPLNRDCPLISLDLFGAALSPGAAASLARALPQSPLSSLDLGGAGLTDSAAEALAHSLKWVRLSCCNCCCCCSFPTVNLFFAANRVQTNQKKKN
jgi:hypothetical protein